MAKKMSPRGAGKPDIELGIKIRALRQARKLSQDDLGKLLGITFQQIAKYEKGVNRVPSSRLQEIAAIFKVPLADFYAVCSYDSGVESLLLEDQPATVKMLRAYRRIQSLETQHRLVAFVQSIAESYG